MSKEKNVIRKSQKIRIHKIHLTVSVIFCILSMHLLSTSIGFSPYFDKIVSRNTRIQSFSTFERFSRYEVLSIYFINIPKSIALQIFGSIGSDPNSFNPFFSHSSFTLSFCDGLNIGDVTSHFGQENPAIFSITPMIGNPTI